MDCKIVDRRPRNGGTPQRLARWLLVACGTTLWMGVLTGCPEEFDPYWRVESYRILGLKSEPAGLKPGDAAAVSVLDYHPEGTDVRYDWSWCPIEPSAQQDYECPLARLGGSEPDGGMALTVDAGARPDGGSGGRPEMETPGLNPELFDLGEGETARLGYPGSRQRVRELCRQLQNAIAGAGMDNEQLGGQLPSEDCSREFEVSVRLEATTANGVQKVAKKDLQLWTGGPDPNRNPGHAGISIRVEKTSDVPTAQEQLDWVVTESDSDRSAWKELTETFAVPVLANMSFEVRAGVQEESVETYRAPPPRGSDRDMGEKKRERLTFRWFLSAGKLRQDQRIHIPGQSSLTEVRTTELSVPGPPTGACDLSEGEQLTEELDEDHPCDMYIWSVVRDDREGLNWSRRRVRVVGTANAGD